MPKPAILPAAHPDGDTLSEFSRALEQLSAAQQALEHVLRRLGDASPRDGTESPESPASCRSAEPLSEATLGRPSGEAWPASVRLRRYSEEGAQAVSVCRWRSAEDEALGAAQRWRDPNSAFHVLWSLAGLVVLFANAMVTPFALAWEPHLLERFGFLSYASFAYWALDILLNFATGYYKDGVLVLTRLDIAKRYLKTSFAPHVVFVALDFFGIVFLAIGSHPVDSRHKFMAQLARVLKIVLLFRITRCARIFDRVTEHILWEPGRLILGMLSVVAVMLWGIHVVACLWWYIGTRLSSNDRRQWTDVFDEGLSNFDQYIVSYHWTIAQVTLGAIDVVSTNSVERMFSIVCLALGLVVGSSVISAFSASLVDLQMANKERNTKMRTLRRFLREHEVPPGLSLTIQRQVTERLEGRKELVESQVAALGSLSASLRTALRVEIARKTLLGHALFVQLSTLGATWCHAFCQDGFELTAWSAKDDIFFASDVSRAAYVLTKGNASYASEVRPGEMLMESQPSEVVLPGMWLAEASLWGARGEGGRGDAGAGLPSLPDSVV